MALRVLVIDDDARLFELLSPFLRQHDVEPTHASSGAQGLRELERERFDAVLLDVMMPGMDGLEVLRRLREKSRIPVLMLTAKGDEADRVVGLELGADDYIAKPFAPRELLARLRAVLRRAQPELDGVRLSSGGIVVELDSREVRVEGAQVELTGLELDLLVALLRRVGRVLPRATLLELAGRSDTAVSERTVDVHISHLRKKLGSLSGRLQTVRGVGYVLTRA